MIKLIIRFRNQEDLSMLGSKLQEKFDVVVDLSQGNLIKKVGIGEKIDVIRKKPTKRLNKPTKMGEYMKHWKEMPEFETDFSKSDYAKIDFVFGDKTTIEDLTDLLEQNITNRTKSVWFPKLIHGQNNNIRVIGGRKAKYPIYVVSKNRSDIGKMHISHWLSNMHQKHSIIVEKQDVEKYEATYGQSEYCNIIELPQTYKDNYDVFDDNIGKKGTTGPGPARNFAMEHSKGLGYQWCWVLDDNTEFPGFTRYYRGRRIPCYSAEVFRTLEDFVDRYENIAQAGLNYSKFCIDEANYPPFVTNTRIYSFLLLRNDLPHRWRGRYNEDTDISLRYLKDGYCTVQQNCYLACKVTTQKVKGGNTEEFYAEEGTKAKSEMLVKMHPDVAKLVWKFSRWHHQVDYSGFTQELKIKPEYEHLLEQQSNEIKENGVRIVRIPKEDVRTDRDTLEYILEHYDNENYYLDENIFLN